MGIFKWCMLTLILSVRVCHASSIPKDSLTVCRTAFILINQENNPEIPIKICTDARQIPVGYQAELDMAVCEDKLCANIILSMYWDLAGNYVRFDTIPGKPLTKFDHKRFTNDDYKKLDYILKDRNSMLRMLDKEDLVDKSIQIKATTVDAVTGATPATIKNAVVEGAVYSSYSLWHMVNDAVKDSMATFTRRIYSGQIIQRLLNSDNFETQLFALRQFKPIDYQVYFMELCQVIYRSIPLIKGYIVGKLPLPFENQELNIKLVSLFPILDSYSKSIFINRIVSDEKLAKVFLPLMAVHIKILESKQLEQILSARKKFE
jgi:hypothetical protein